MKENIKSKDVGRGTFSLIGTRFLLILLAIVQFTLIPRLLNPVGMGYYSYWLSIFFILSAILGLGAFPLLSRYLPELRLRARSAIKPFLKQLLLIKFPIFFLLLILGLIIFPFSRSAYLAICLGSFIAAVELMVEGIIYGFNIINIFSLMPLSRISSRIIILIVLFPLLGSKGILLSILIAPLITLLIFSGKAQKMLPLQSGKLDRPFIFYLKTGSWLYLTNILSVLTFWSIISLSRVLVNDLVEIGFLGLALQICLLSSFLIFSLAQSLLPTFVQFHLLKDIRLTSSIRLSWKYTNILLFPLVAAILTLIKPVIRIIIGDIFLASVPLINLLLPNIIFFCWVFLLEQILIIHEKMRSVFLIELLRFIIFLLIATFLIHRIGILGGPIALTTASLAGFLISLITAARLEKIGQFLSSILKPFICSVLMGTTIYLINPVTTVKFICSTILSPILYFTILYWIKGFSKKDLHRFKYVIFKNTDLQGTE